MNHILSAIWDYIIGDVAFWVATVGATIVKLLTAVDRSWRRALATAVAAILSAYIFTDASLSIFGLDPDTFRVPAAALWALTGEGLMRWAIDLSHNLPNNPKEIMDLIRDWRRGGK